MSKIESNELGDRADVRAEAEFAHDQGPDLLGITAGVGLAIAASAAMRVQAQSAGDNTILNALITAEYQAIKAYTAGAGILQNPPQGDALASAAPTVLAVAVHFQSQHRDHVEALSAKLTADGGTPVTEDSVTFTPPAGFTPGVLNVIKLAANAEKAAAVAYADTLKMLSAQAAAQLISSIGAVETQHFIVLSLLAQGVIQATPATMAMAMDVVPRSFVNPQNGDAGLMTVADFTYSAP